MFRCHAPECAGVRRADGLALEQHRRVAVQQRPVDDVGVTDDPADVGRGPVDLARLDAVDVLHGPVERHRVAAVVAHDALRLAGRAGGVQNVERVGRVDGHTVLRRRARQRILPVDVPRWDELCLELRTLQHDAARGLVLRQLQRLVEQRFVLDDAGRLDAAGRGHDRLGRRVVDAGRQLVRRETAEDDRVHGPDPGAGEHGDDRLRDHRHVDDDPVPLLDAVVHECPGEQRDVVTELAVADRALRLRHRAVVDDGCLVAAAAGDVTVDRVVAGVEPAAGKPPVERRVGVIENLVPATFPVDVFGRFAPEVGRFLDGAAVDF